jgi:hypothetical protein
MAQVKEAKAKKIFDQTGQLQSGGGLNIQTGSGSSSEFGPGDYLIAQVSITTTGGKVKLFIRPNTYLDYGDAGGTSSAEYRYVRSGTVIRRFVTPEGAGMVPPTIVDDPGVGTFTYQIRINITATNGFTDGGMIITAMEI